MKYGYQPYIMRYNRYDESPYRGIYINIASWCNQPNIFKKMSYQERCDKENERYGGSTATKRYNDYFRQQCPEIADQYFDMKFNKNSEGYYG
jgi:hypothetical protein